MRCTMLLPLLLIYLCPSLVSAQQVGYVPLCILHSHRSLANTIALDPSLQQSTSMAHQYPPTKNPAGTWANQAIAVPLVYPAHGTTEGRSPVALPASHVKAAHMILAPAYVPGNTTAHLPRHGTRASRRPSTKAKARAAIASRRRRTITVAPWCPSFPSPLPRS